MIAFIHASASYDWEHLRHFLAWAFNPDNWFTNASEQLIAFVFVAVGGSLLWPPTRRRIHAFVDKKLKPIHDHFTATHASNAELHRKLDHIIEHHPDIPALPPKKGVRSAPRPKKE